MHRKPTYEELERKIKRLERKTEMLKAVDKSRKTYKDRFEALLNATTDSAFLVDTSGNILALNQTAARRLGKSTDKLIGKNSFQFMSPKVAKHRKAIARKTIRTGKPIRFQDERESMIFDSTIYPIVDRHGKVIHLAIYARDITRQKKLEKRLRKREKILNAQKKALEEVNSSLRVLLKQRTHDKTEMEEKVLFNVKELVVPYAEKLQKSRLDEKQTAYLKVLESNLNSIISPFAYTLSSKFLGLTPKEIQVANLVKDGKTAKHIAELFNVSVRTVEAHKRSIRTKTRIKNSKTNLRSYLLSL
jgi:PAS domain S-box-containing protein